LAVNGGCTTPSFKAKLTHRPSRGSNWLRRPRPSRLSFDPSHPLILARNGGHGSRDITIDAEVIKRWFQDHRTTNIDLMTSVSFDVIDVDGEAAIAALEDVRAEGNGCNDRQGYHANMPAGATIPSADWLPTPYRW
jgi:Bifunctional DNA primase/polymerase, N-terminal